jgi:hypothetical protein
MGPGLIFGIFIIFAIVGIVTSSIYNQKRREELQELARKLGFMYSAERDRHIDDRYRFLNTLRVGSNRYAYNILSGTYEGYDMMVFDYHYQTKSNDKTHNHYSTFCILEMEKAFPELLITREGIFSKIGQALGYNDIDFESHEFSRKFCVRSKDKKFAYDFCNSQMIEFFLANDDLNIEVEENIIAMCKSGRMKTEEIEHNIGRIRTIRSLMPNYLFQ